MTDSLLLATTNLGKIREIRRLLAGGPPLLTLAEIGPVPEPAETGLTFADNAAIKALAYATATGLPVIAEDSGLAIDALGGAPGVHSARYPGDTYPDKFRNLYDALSSHPRPWTARYVCAVAIAGVPRSRGPEVVVSGGPEVLFATEGVCDGEIWPEPRGTHGFGYDPIFYFPQYDRTFGEVDDDEKLAADHRGRAFRRVAAWLATRDARLR